MFAWSISPPKMEVRKKLVFQYRDVPLNQSSTNRAYVRECKVKKLRFGYHKQLIRWV